MDTFQRFEQEVLRPPPDLEPPASVVAEPAELFRFQRSLHTVAAPVRAIPSGTIDRTRLQMRQAMYDYLATQHPDHMLLIKAVPGVGKTTAGVEVAETLGLAGKRVLYAGPRHDFFADVMAVSRHPELWFEWLPRQAQNEEKQQVGTCIHVEAISAWLNKGYEARNFCEGICGWPYIKGGCVYHAQAETPKPVIFGQHAHVALLHPLEFNVVFIDETPIGAFLHEWVIGARWIAPSGMNPTEPLTPILHALAGLAVGKEQFEGPELLAHLGGAKDVAEACELFRMAADALAEAPKIRFPGDAEKADYFHLPQLVRELHREARAALANREYPHRVIVSGGNLILLLRRPGNDKLPAHIIALDATAEPRQYEAVFKRQVQVVDASPALLGHVYQVYDRANGKAAVSADAQQLKQQVLAIAKRYEHPAVITYQAQAGQMDGLPALHFYAARGTNQFEHCDALIVAGTPQPPIFAIEKKAKMIFAERMLPFVRNWSTELRTYAYTAPDGQGRAYPVSGFWSDPDLQAVLWSLREAELIQAAHRARPLLHETDIWLLSNVPLPELPPDKLLSIREVMGTPDGVSVWKWDETMAALDWAANGLLESKGCVALSDLMQMFAVDRKTARKYLSLLADTGEWVLTKVATGGRPGMALIRPAMGDFRE